MRKVLLLLVGTAVLWLPAVSVAGDSSQPAAARAEGADAPSRASNPAHICHRGSGTNSFGKCVSAAASHEAERDNGGTSDREDGRADGRGRSGANPARTCKAMWSHDRVHFQTAYGTRPNAFGKCVSSHATGEDG